MFDSVASQAGQKHSQHSVQSNEAWGALLHSLNDDVSMMAAGMSEAFDLVHLPCVDARLLLPQRLCDLHSPDYREVRRYCAQTEGKADR